MGIDISPLATFIVEMGVLLGVVAGVFATCRALICGVRCLLRSQMLEIYYHNADSGTIRQYEKENFIMLYGAYKALKGNSFIDTIYKEVMAWKVVT